MAAHGAHKEGPYGQRTPLAWSCTPDFYCQTFFFCGLFFLSDAFFPRSKRVIVMHPGLIAHNYSVQVSRIFCHKMQKFWCTLSIRIRIWSLVSMSGNQVEAMYTISSFSVRIQWIIVQGMCRRASRALVDKYGYHHQLLFKQ